VLVAQLKNSLRYLQKRACLAWFLLYK